MKVLFIIPLFIFFSCTHAKKGLPKSDLFDRLIKVHKVGTKTALIEEFGSPIEKKRESQGSTEYRYKEFSTSIDDATERVVGTSVPFWVNYDAYSYLKKRFQSYTWKEEELPGRKLDYAEEIHKVDIPELGITFEYDEQDPLRRPMWIFIR